jgi:hypothetical protein
LQIIDRKKIKFLQETWFIREKKSPVGHVFCLEVLRDKEQGIRLKARKINGLED